MKMKVRHCGMAVLWSLTLAVTGCKEQKTGSLSPVGVKVMRVTAEAVDNGRRYSGTVEESSGSVLSFAVAGTVSGIRVEPGQRVEKGELIASLDKAVLHSAHDVAAATLMQAEDALLRMKQLHDAGSLPEMQWVEVQSKLKQAQSAEAIAKRNLADGSLYAPFSGVVSEKSVETGHNVMPGMPVVKLVDIRTVKVCISVPENEISRIDAGQAVSVSVSALGGKAFEGKVVEKGVSASSLSRSYEVKALVDNPQGELMPGMICELRLDSQEKASAIILPCRVVSLDSSNRPFVWINKNGKAQKRTIVTGTLTRDGVAVVSGLSAGDEVIVEGQQKVSTGMDVEIRQD